MSVFCSVDMPTARAMRPVWEEEERTTLCDPCACVCLTALPTAGQLTAAKASYLVSRRGEGPVASLSVCFVI